MLISAFVAPRGHVQAVIAAAEVDRYQLVLSEEILGEVERVLTTRPRLQRRYAYTADQVRAFVAGLRNLAEIVEPLPGIRGIVRDPADDHVIAAALAAAAEVIVTGDAGLLDLGMHEGIAILTPRAFLERLEHT